jgi:hypothetical protein
MVFSINDAHESCVPPECARYVECLSITRKACETCGEDSRMQVAFAELGVRVSVLYYLARVWPSRAVLHLPPAVA